MLFQDHSPPVLVIGAGSAAGQAIAERLAERQVIAIARRSTGSNDIVVMDYDLPPPPLPWRGATVINCVGTPIGDRATLDRVNVAVAARWADAAAAGGAARFVQLSSFAVYGLAEWIDTDTPIIPTTDYGHSKLVAERALTRRDDDLAVSILRVPMLVSTKRPGKLGSLLTAIVRSRLLPMPPGDVRRSMLTYAALADAVADGIARGDVGIHNLADAEPFSYTMVRDLLDEAGRPTATLPVPNWVRRVLAQVAPAAASRLLVSSMLAPFANANPRPASAGDLRAVMRAIIAAQIGR